MITTAFNRRLNRCLLEADDLTRIARKLADAGEETETRRKFLSRGLGATVAGGLNPLAATASPAAIATSHNIKNLLLSNRGLWSRLLAGEEGESVSTERHLPQISGNALVNMLRTYAGGDDGPEILTYRKTLISSLTDSDLKTVIAQCGTENERHLLLHNFYSTALDFDDELLDTYAKLSKGYGISGDDVLQLAVDNARDVIYNAGRNPKELQLCMSRIQETIDQLSNKLEKVGLKPSITQNAHNYIKRVQKDAAQRIEQAERKEAIARDKTQDQYDLMRWEDEGGALGSTNESKFARRLSRKLLAKSFV